MKDETGKRFSKLRAFAKDAFANQDYDYRDDEYYHEDEDSYDKAGSKSESEYNDAPSSSFSSYSSQSSYKSSYSSGSGSASSSSSYGGYSSSYGDTASSGTIYRMDGKSKFRLSILRLEKLDDAVKVADEIMSGNTITLVDLRCVQKDTVRRIIDFLDGVRYTCEAKMEIVADYTYVVVPRDVELSGDLFSQIDTGSLS